MFFSSFSIAFNGTTCTKIAEKMDENIDSIYDLISDGNAVVESRKLTY